MDEVKKELFLEEIKRRGDSEADDEIISELEDLKEFIGGVSVVSGL